MMRKIFGLLIVSLFASGHAVANSGYVCTSDSGVCELKGHTPLPHPIKTPPRFDIPNPRNKYAKPVKGLKPVECSFSIEKGSINADLQTDFEESTSISFNNVYSSHACGMSMKKYFKKHKQKVCLQPDTLDSQTVLQVKALGNTTQVAKLDRLLPCNGGIISPPVIPPVERIQPIRRPSNIQKYNGGGGSFNAGRTYSQ